MVLPRLPNFHFHCPCGGALSIAVDVATGAPVAADNNDALGAVVPSSLTKDEGAFVGASVAFEVVYVHSLADFIVDVSVCCRNLP